MRALIEVEAPGAIGNRVQINATAGSSQGPSVKSEGALRRGVLKAARQSVESARRIRGCSAARRAIGCAGGGGRVRTGQSGGAILERRGGLWSKSHRISNQREEIQGLGGSRRVGAVRSYEQRFKNIPAVVELKALEHDADARNSARQVCDEDIRRVRRSRADIVDGNRSGWNRDAGGIAIAPGASVKGGRGSGGVYPYRHRPEVLVERLRAVGIRGRDGVIALRPATG